MSLRICARLSQKPNFRECFSPSGAGWSWLRRGPDDSHAHQSILYHHNCTWQSGQCGVLLASYDAQAARWHNHKFCVPTKNSRATAEMTGRAARQSLVVYVAPGAYLKTCNGVLHTFALVRCPPVAAARDLFKRMLLLLEICERVNWPNRKMNCWEERFSTLMTRVLAHRKHWRFCYLS